MKKKDNIRKIIYIFIGMGLMITIIICWFKFQEREYVKLSKEFYGIYFDLAENLIKVDSIEEALLLIKEDASQESLAKLQLTLSVLEGNLPDWKYPFYIDMKNILDHLSYMNERAERPYGEVSISERGQISVVLSVMESDINDWKDNKYNRLFW